VTQELVLDFVNTRGIEPRRDDLDSPRALSMWFADRGLVNAGCRATGTDLREAREVREAIRTLLAAHNALPGAGEAATETLQRAARRTGLAVRFTDTGYELEPTAAGVRGALGRVLVAVAATMADGTWSRLKVCRADDCAEAFLDTAKNRSRAWCSMESCGNRHKVRAYRARHAG
jgi:predicted RNA-binding Zn ribbon-like protein